MRDDLEVTGSININASAAKVWDALTDPEIIKEYLFGSETVTDWKVGSEVAFQGEYNGQKYRDHGMILENSLHEKISYTYWSAFNGLEDEPENYSLVSYGLKPKSEQVTELSWTMRGYATEAAYNQSKEGMKAFLEQIKGIIER
jgi:uncharacterized protein YndB with AHSA1/START domain